MMLGSEGTLRIGYKAGSPSALTYARYAGITRCLRLFSSPPTALRDPTARERLGRPTAIHLAGLQDLTAERRARSREGRT